MRIRWTSYGEKRFRERLEHGGASKADLESAVRLANTTKKRDEWDPDGTEDEPRVRRWVQVMLGGKAVRLRVVLLIGAERTSSDPGEILILNVMEVKAATGR